MPTPTDQAGGPQRTLGSATCAAEKQRRYRRSRALRLKIGEAFVDHGRIGQWDEHDLSAIDTAILKLACDWVQIVTSNGCDPVRRASDLNNDDSATAMEPPTDACPSR